MDNGARRHKARSVKRRQRGVALLLVFWLLLLLTSLVSIFALTARTESLQGRYLERSSAARFAAEAGIDVAALRLRATDDATRWVPDGRAYAFDFDGYQIQVQVVDESAKVDLNVAGADVLSGLIVALGIDAERAQTISGAIMDWRDPDNLISAGGGAEDRDYAAADRPYGAKDRPFETVTELQQVLGMDAAVYHLLEPYLTIYTGLDRPSASFAAEPVLHSLGLPEDQVAQIIAQRSAWQPGGAILTLPDGSPFAGQGTGTYSISSHATRSDGTQAVITTTIRLGGSGAFGQLYAPLSWRVGESD